MPSFSPEFNLRDPLSSPTTMAALGSGALAVMLLVIGTSCFVMRRRRRRWEADRSRLFGSTVKQWQNLPMAKASFRIQPPSRAESGEYFSSDDDVFSPHAKSSRDAKDRARKASSRSHYDAHRSISRSGSRAGGLSVYGGDSRQRWCSTAEDSHSAKDSFESAGGDSGAAGGLIWRLSFKVEYIETKQILAVTIFRAKCSPAHHVESPTSDIYAVVILEPGNDRRQTPAYPNNGAPSFDDVFCFEQVPADAVNGTTVRLSLYDVDRATRTRLSLGHVRVPLAELQLQNGGSHYLNRHLTTGPGALEVHVSLCYHPDKEKLKVQVFAARNLPESPSGRQFYLRTQVIVGTQTVKIKRSPPSHSLASIFQCSYAFQVPLKHLDACCIQLAVIASDRPPHVSCGQMTAVMNPSLWQQYTTETLVGVINIGSIVFTHGAGVEHWRQMLKDMRRTHEMWHKLLPPASGGTSTPMPLRHKNSTALRPPTTTIQIHSD